jgi:hypothetical protein
MSGVRHPKLVGLIPPKGQWSSGDVPPVDTEL